MPRRKPVARANCATVGELLLPSPPADDSLGITEDDVPTNGGTCGKCRGRGSFTVMRDDEPWVEPCGECLGTGQTKRSDVALQERHTLAAILDTLVAYQDTRDMAETDEDRAAIDAEIATRQQDLIRKVDRYAAVMRRLEVEAGWEKAEAERHARRRKRYEAALEFLERYAITAMQAAGTRKLEGHGAALKLKAGPGVLVVTAECDVPAEFKAVTVTMPLEVWDNLLHSAGATGMDQYIGSIAVLKNRVKSAIKDGAEVPGCDITFDDGLVLE